MKSVPRTRHAIRAALLAGLCGALAACETAPPPTVSIVGLLERPGEHALVAGLIDYDDGAFDRAEKNFRSAVTHGLLDSRDTAVAYKHLAFIACAFSHLLECEADFRSAFAADPQFHLTAAEIGHPVWGPVYRRVAAAQPSAAANERPADRPSPR